MDDTDPSNNTMIALNKIRVGMAETQVSLKHFDITKGTYSPIGAFDRSLIMQQPVSAYNSMEKTMYVQLADRDKYFLYGMNVTDGNVTVSYPILDSDKKPLKAQAIFYDSSLNSIFAFI
jgi:hypothetical protein